MTDDPNDQNTVTVDLVEIIPEVAPETGVEIINSLYPTANAVARESLARSFLSPSKTAKVDDALSPSKKVLSIDVETTGINPWDYQFLVCSVWDLSKPKTEMVTFAGWDEEQLCLDLFEYIAQEDPDVLLAYNAKYEVRCFVSRAALYHIRAPWIWDVEWHDLMTMLEGGWKNYLSGSQPTGSEENWLEFFFGERKPFTIDECFEGVRSGDLTPFIIRNRTCVQGQGDIYKLLLYASAEWGETIREDKPSSARVSELAAEGLVTLKCEVCEAVNEVKASGDPGQCWRCMARLPQPSSINILKEQVRTVDLEKVGLD